MDFEIKKDEMTPKERMRAFMKGEEIDRIPCFPFMGDTMTPLTGNKLSAYYHSPELMAEVEIACFKMFGHDGVGVGPGLHAIPEAMGTELKFPDNGVAFVSKPFLKDYADIDKLSPADPYRDGRLPLFLKALEIINKEIGDQVDIGSCVGGPFTAAAGLRGTENFLRDLQKRPEMAHRLLELVTESALRYIDAVCDLGFTPSIAEPTATGTIISARQFQEFAVPYLKKYVERIYERCGKGPSLHICGNSKKIWQGMVDTGAPLLSLDNEVDLAEAKEAVGDKVCLMGNVSPVETVKKGTREQILAEAKECIRKAYDNPKGYILATGCQIPVGTPPENIKALMDAARIYGRMPIDPERLI